MCILLSIITGGIYGIYWMYLLVKNVKALKQDNGSCTGEMLCLIFVPFYSLYWWFTRGKLVRDEFSKHGYSASSNETAFLVLALFGLGIVAMAIMQHDFNSLPSESTQSDQRSASKFARYHCNQGLVLAIAEIIFLIICGILDGLPLIGWIFGIVEGLSELACFLLAVLGIINAANGKAKELPIVGGFKLLK